MHMIPRMGYLPAPVKASMFSYGPLWVAMLVVAVALAVTTATRISTEMGRRH